MADESNSKKKSAPICRNSGPSIGIAVGAVIAGLISWEHTHSLGWTLLHVFFNWIYVIYSWITGKVYW